MPDAKKDQKENSEQFFIKDPLSKELKTENADEMQVSQDIATDIEEQQPIQPTEMKKSRKLEGILEGREFHMEDLDVIFPQNVEDEDKDATAKITVTSDRMMAKITLKRPGKRGKPLTEEMLFNQITEEGITTGIEKKYISRLAKYPVYDVPFQIALGKAVVNGTDGYIIPYFEPSKEAKDDVEEEIIDFKTVDFIRQVEKGQLLCDIVLPTIGEDGYDIFGTVLPAKQGTPVSAPNGTNTYFSEDELQLFADCNGHAYFKQGQISVQNVMIVNNVDYSTGNIVFSGDVTVKGDVKSGFFVRADGNIIIEGSVEESVSLQAKGDIFITKGVNGKNGSIVADGSLKVGYLQHATVNVKENILADSIINCHITCGADMKLSGKNGRIVGGQCKIGGSILATQIGNVANIPTEIELMGPYFLTNKKSELEEEIEQCEEKIRKIDLLITMLSANKDPSKIIENKKNILKTRVSKRQLEDEIKNLTEEVSTIASQIKGQTAGKVSVMGNLFSNVHINIDGVFFHNSIWKNRCTIYKQDDKIVIA